VTAEQTAAVAATAIGRATAGRFAGVAAATIAAVMTKQTAAMATTAIGRSATSGRTTAAVAGDGHFLTADQGDADNRAEKRDAKNERTIHPRILQKGTGT
jgi:hypothetical protein